MKLLLPFLVVLSINWTSKKAVPQERTNLLASMEDSLELMETQRIYLDHCIPLYSTNKIVIITDKIIFDSLAAKNSYYERCIEISGDIDFDNTSLIGINLNTGWCRAPLGLSYKTFKLEIEKRYLFTVSYETPIEPCRARSSYDLWVSVPKLPDGYQVTLQIDPIHTPD